MPLQGQHVRLHLHQLDGGELAARMRRSEHLWEPCVQIRRQAVELEKQKAARRAVATASTSRAQTRHSR